MIKVKLYYYVVSGGDGSAYPKFFTTQEKRDAYMEAEENSKHFEGFCEADGEVEFEVDENGIVPEKMPDWLLKPGDDGKSFLEKYPEHEWQKFDPKPRKSEPNDDDEDEED